MHRMYFTINNLTQPIKELKKKLNELNSIYRVKYPFCVSYSNM